MTSLRRRLDKIELLCRKITLETFHPEHPVHIVLEGSHCHPPDIGNDRFGHFFWSWSKETFRSGPKAPFPSRVGRSVRQCPEMAVNLVDKDIWGGVPDLLCFGETARKPPECHHSHVFMCLRCVSKVVELEISGMFWGSLSCLYLRVALLDWVLLVHEQFSWASIMDPVQRAAFQLSLHAAYPYPRLSLPDQEPFGARS